MFSNTETSDKLRIQVVLSDPWDLGESCGWKPLYGYLLRLALDAPGGRALLKFERPIGHRGATYEFAIAAPRHQGSSLESLKAGESVFCSFLGIAGDVALTDPSLFTKQWRGGLSFIGDLRAASESSSTPA